MHVMDPEYGPGQLLESTSQAPSALHTNYFYHAASQPDYYVFPIVISTLQARTRKVFVIVRNIIDKPVQPYTF